MLVSTLIVLSIPNNVKLGTLYFQSYEYDKAFTLLRGDDFKSIKDIRALIKIKDYFKVNGQISKAVLVQERIVQLKSKNISAVEELETLYQWNGDILSYLKTKEKRAELLKNTETYVAMLFEIANEYRWYKQLQDSNRVFYQAYNTGKLEEEQKVAIVEYLLASRQIDEAIKILNELIPESPVYRKYLFEAYRESGNIDKAIKEGLLLITKNEKSKEMINSSDWLDLINRKEVIENKALINDVITLYEVKGDKELVSSILEKIFLKNPEDMASCLNIAYHFKDIGEVEKANKYFYHLKKAKMRRIHYFYEAAEHFRDVRDLETAKYFLESVTKITRKRKYIESLAEVYEELGLKKKALELYLEIYKGFNQSMRQEIFPRESWTAQAGLSSIKRTKRDRLTKVLKDKVRIEKKIIDLFNDLGQRERAVPFYEEVLSKKPNDLEALKGLGYYYLEVGDRRSFEKFERAIEVNSKDEDSLIVLTDFHVQRKEYKKADEYHKRIIKNKENPYVQELRFEIIKNEYPDELREFCRDMYLAGREKYRIPVYQCYLEEKKYDAAFEIAKENYNKSGKTQQDILDFVYVASVSENYSDAREAIELGRRKGLYDKKLYEAEKSLEYYINDSKLKKAYIFKADVFALRSSDLKYIGTNLKAGKRFNSFQLIYLNEKIWFKDTINSKLESQGLELSYIQDSYTLSSRYIVNDYAQEEARFDLDYSKYNQNYFFIVSTSQNAFEYPARRALEGKNSFKKEYKAYYERTHEKEASSQTEIAYKDVLLWNQEKPSVLALSQTNWFLFKWKAYIGPTLNFSTRSGGETLTDEIYLKESLIYGAYFRKRWEFIERLFPSSNVFLKFGILGDALNSTIIGKLWAFELNFSREIGLNKSIDFNYRHDQSVLSGSKNGEIDFVKLSLKYWF